MLTCLYGLSDSCTDYDRSLSYSHISHFLPVCRKQEVLASSVIIKIPQLWKQHFLFLKNNTLKKPFYCIILIFSSVKKVMKMKKCVYIFWRPAINIKINKYQLYGCSLSVNKTLNISTRLF